MTNQNLIPIEIQSYSGRELKTEYEYEYEYEYESPKNILNIRYEALRREVIESIESERERKITPPPASQELFILTQRGMIGWMEEWTKFHPGKLNTLNNNEKIKGIAFNETNPKSDTDTDTDTDTDIYTLALYNAGNLPLNLQGQLENLLTHMVLSTLYPPTQNQPQPQPQSQSQSQSQYFPFAR